LTDQLDNQARTRILHVAEDAAGSSPRRYYVLARALILRSEGLLYLAESWYDERQDLLNYLLNTDSEKVPDVIEALSLAFDNQQSYYGTMQSSGRSFEKNVNIVLRQHRISYDFVGNHMVEHSTSVLHTEVVMPTLRLLSGRAGWSGVENAYQEALVELSAGRAPNAITDASTALQEALTACGCEGANLGPLISSARKKGLLAAHDSPMLNAIEKSLQWVSADRANTGDAHSTTAASVEDAWLAVHIVGAIILRLSKVTAQNARGLK